MMDESQLYNWRDGLFYAHKNKGNFESMVFYCHPTYLPSQNILKSIVAKGGFIIDNPTKDDFTVILVDAQNYKSNDSQFKGSYDLFDCNFIEQCVEKKEVSNLNCFRIGESVFKEYDANEVLKRRLKWSSIRKKQNAGLDVITECSVHIDKIDIVNSSNDAGMSDSIQQCEIVNTANLKQATQRLGSCNSQEHVRRRRSRIRETTPVEPPMVVFKVPETPPGSSKQATSERIANKKIVLPQLTNNSCDTTSSASLTMSKNLAPAVSKQRSPLNRPPTVESLKPNSLSLTEANLNMSNEKEKNRFVALNNQNKTVVPQKPSNASKSSHSPSSSSSSQSSIKSSSSDTLLNDSPPISTRLTRSQNQNCTTSKTNHSNSKSPLVSASKPSSSIGSKTAESITSKYFNNRSFQRKEKPIATPAPDAASSSHQSLLLSALREINESKSPTKVTQVSRKRRYVEEEEDTREGRGISPIDSVSGDDFDRSSVLSSVSSKRRSYTDTERNLILTFICEHNYHQFVNGNKIWQELEDEKIIRGRTWQSLREHFVKQMFPKILNNRQLGDTDKRKFERAIKIIKLGKKAKAPI